METQSPAVCKINLLDSEDVRAVVRLERQCHKMRDVISKVILICLAAFVIFMACASLAKQSYRTSLVYGVLFVLILLTFCVVTSEKAAVRLFSWQYRRKFEKQPAGAVLQLEVFPKEIAVTRSSGKAPVHVTSSEIEKVTILPEGMIMKLRRGRESLSLYLPKKCFSSPEAYQAAVQWHQ